MCRCWIFLKSRLGEEQRKIPKAQITASMERSKGISRFETLSLSPFGAGGVTLESENHSALSDYKTAEENLVPDVT